MINLNDPRTHAAQPTKTTDVEREQRQRAAEAKQLFRPGPSLNFSKPDPTPAIRDEGGTDFSSLSALRISKPAPRTREARLDALAAPVARLSTREAGLSLEALELLQALHVRRGADGTAQAFIGDLAAEAGMTWERCEGLLKGLTAAKLITTAGPRRWALNF